MSQLDTDLLEAFATQRATPRQRIMLGRALQRLLELRRQEVEILNELKRVVREEPNEYVVRSRGSISWQPNRRIVAWTAEEAKELFGGRCEAELVRPHE